MEKYIRYETPGNVSIISEQKKHPETCKIYSQNQHYKHTGKIGIIPRLKSASDTTKNRHFKTVK